MFDNIIISNKRKACRENDEKRNGIKYVQHKCLKCVAGEKLRNMKILKILLFGYKNKC